MSMPKDIREADWPQSTWQLLCQAAQGPVGLMSFSGRRFPGPRGFQIAAGFLERSGYIKAEGTEPLGTSYTTPTYVATDKGKEVARASRVATY